MLIGEARRPPHDRRRVPMSVHPLARERLRTLLFEPELQAVGYSEFIHRACEAAKTEIAEQRRNERRES